MENAVREHANLLHTNVICCFPSVHVDVETFCRDHKLQYVQNDKELCSIGKKFNCPDRLNTSLEFVQFFSSQESMSSAVLSLIRSA